MQACGARAAAGKAAKKPPRKPLAAGHEAGSKTRLRPPATAVGARPPDTPLPGAFHSLSDSKFKAPKTPPSHGLTGLAAIKQVAKSVRACRVRAAAESPVHGPALNWRLNRLNRLISRGFFAAFCGQSRINAA